MNDIEMNIKMRRIITYNNTYVYKKYAMANFTHYIHWISKIGYIYHKNDTFKIILPK